MTDVIRVIGVMTDLIRVTDMTDLITVKGRNMADLITVKGVIWQIYDRPYHGEGREYDRPYHGKGGNMADIITVKVICQTFITGCWGSHDKTDVIK